MITNGASSRAALACGVGEVEQFKLILWRVVRVRILSKELKQ